jgi:hypothetical protein
MEKLLVKVCKALAELIDLPLVPSTTTGPWKPQLTALPGRRDTPVAALTRPGAWNSNDRRN